MTSSWVPGMKSPNPAGRGAMPTHIKMAIRKLSPKAIEIIEKCLDSDDERLRFEAAKEILNRDFGKPHQSSDVSISAENNSLADVPVADLVEFAKKNL